MKLIKNIHIFGCSFSAEYHEDTDNYIKYKEWMGGKFPKTWFQLLSENLGIDYINHAIHGAGNDLIFDTVTRKINEVKKNDIVIVGWSFLSRFLWADYDTSKWVPIHFGRNYSVLSDKRSISEKTIEEIVYNRTSDYTYNLYSDLISARMDLIKYISKVVGFHIFFWSCDPYVIYNKPIEKRCDKTIINSEEISLDTDVDNFLKLVEKNGGTRIKDETNNKIFDFHMSEKGHHVMFELIHQHITKNT